MTRALDPDAAAPRARVILDAGALDGVLLDLDGVLTDTARLHEAAWRRVFDAFFAARAAEGGPPAAPFTTAEYRDHVDGRPRLEGVAGVLRARGIALPWGSGSDPPGAPTVQGLGRAKNDAFRAVIEAEGVQLRPGAREFLRRARAAGLRVAIVTASRNARAVLSAAGLGGLFDVLVDGNAAAEGAMAGKPAPDTLQEAARRLGVAPARAAVVEDAAAGVAAARAGGFARVIGIGGDGTEARLLASGAEAVVPDLAAIRVTGAAGAAAAIPAAPTDPAEILAVLGGREPALFLDYDGTLTPIVDRPEMAVLPEEMRAVLGRLAARVPVCIVSGRGREDLARLVGLDSVISAGAHGFDILGPPGSGLRVEHGAAFRDDLATAARRLAAELAGVPGALVEDKRLAVAVHYRLVDPADVPAVRRAVERVLADIPRLSRIAGKKVIELRPALDWDKGRAVTWLIGTLGLDRPERLPVYVGDDATDEDAFAALAGNGLTILVAQAPRATRARYRLRDPDAVREFLTGLSRALERGNG